MPRFKRTPEGRVPMTAEEEAQRDAEEAEFATAQADPDTPEESGFRRDPLVRFLVKEIAALSGDTVRQVLGRLRAELQRDPDSVARPGR